MEKLNRRNFIHKSTLGIAGAFAGTSVFAGIDQESLSPELIDMVPLGPNGLKVPRLAFGTGSRGWMKTSNQKKLGEQKFTELASYAYDRGVRFFETADMYGTHEFVGKAMKKFPRENITLLSKMMVYEQEGWYKPEPFKPTFDRFRKELDTDYIDILLLHCMVNTNWTKDYKQFMDDFLAAKQKGQVKMIGLSCHDLGALKVAAESPWADVILARINHKGARMDGPPDEIMAVLKKAKESGKGILGMKIFGCGDLTKEDERQKSLEFVIKSRNVDSMTIGFESKEQIDDTIGRIMKLAKG